MTYAQKDYQQIQGINGKYRIADIGCFITSFCNLELDFGIVVNPAQLDNVFRDGNRYIDVDDGIRDDVRWDFIGLYDGNTHFTGTGSGGWPQTNQAIVKFHYRSIQHPTLPDGRPNMIDHFCKVADWTARTIVDSWDGLTKPVPAAYGQVVEWATYEHIYPAPPPPAVTVHPYTIRPCDPYKARTKLAATWLYRLNYDNMPALAANHAETMSQGFEFTVTAELQHNVGKTFLLREGYAADSPTGFIKEECEPVPTVPIYVPPAAPLPVPTAQRYPVVNTIKHYDDPGKAVFDNDAKGTVAPGLYYLFATKGRAVQIGKSNMKADYWINAADNVPIEPVPVITNVPAAVVANVPVPAPTPITDIQPAVAPVETSQTIITMDVQLDTPQQIRASYRKYFGGPIECRVLRDITVKNLFDKSRTIAVKQGRTIKVYGTVEENGMTYAVTRSKADADAGRQFPNTRDMYAIRVISHENFGPDLKELFTLVDNVKATAASFHDSFEEMFDKRFGSLEGILKIKKMKK